MARQALFAAVAATTVALVGAVDTTTVSLLAPLVESEDVKLVGSVIGVDGDKTTYAVGCEAGTPEDKCLVGSASRTVVQGPSTFVQSIHVTMSDWDELVGDEVAGEAASDMEELLHQTATVSNEFSCELNPKQNQAECDFKVAVAVGSDAYSMQANKALSSYRELMTAVVITAGADKLSPAPGATQTGNVPATTGGADASRTTGAAVTSSATRSGSKAPASTTSASTTSATTNAAGALTPRNLGLACVAAVIGRGLLHL